MRNKLLFVTFMLVACGSDGAGLDYVGVGEGGTAGDTFMSATGGAGGAGGDTAPSATGGTSALTGGTPAATGGTPVTTGGIGGTPIATGGATGGTATGGTPGRPLGDACATTSQCAVGVCLNDRCCERACDSTCEGCNRNTGKCEPRNQNNSCDTPHCKSMGGGRELECAFANPSPYCKVDRTSTIWYELGYGSVITPVCQNGVCVKVVAKVCATAFAERCGRQTTTREPACYVSF